MQVKKFEAPTIQEALDNVKRDLGPEAIILQTKRNRRGFGLLSKASIEVTAAVSERSLQKKQTVEDRMTETGRSTVKSLPAERQADLIDKYTDRNLAQASRTKENVEVTAKTKKITATRYIDIEDGDAPVTSPSKPVSKPSYDKPLTQKSVLPETLAPKTVAPTVMAGADLSLQEEVRTLKQFIEELRVAKEAPAESTTFQTYAGIDSPVLQAAFEQLTLNGVNRQYAYSLVKKVAFELEGQKAKLFQSEKVLDCLASEIMHSVEVHEIFPKAEEADSVRKAHVVALVGPTGMGKTTTIAKLASEAMTKHKLKVGLVNLDQQKVGAFDQLGTYAKILNVPFRSASSIEDFRAAIRDFQNVDFVFVDTGGFSQKDAVSLKNATEILHSVADLKVYLLLSAITRETELFDAANKFSVLRPRGVIMSKLDEANLYGCLYNVSQKVKLPLVYFTTGQRIPEDIEPATPERVVSLVMDL